MRAKEYGCYKTEVTTDVEIEFSDIIEAIPTDMLVEELERRNKALAVAGDDSDAIDNALFHYRSGNLGECLRYVERILPRSFVGIADKFFPVH